MGVVIMVIGALLQANSYTKTHIAIARVVAGIGMGFINSTVPVFQAEFSPKATRGLCKQIVWNEEIEKMLMRFQMSVSNSPHSTLESS